MCCPAPGRELTFDRANHGLCRIADLPEDRCEDLGRETVRVGHVHVTGVVPGWSAGLDGLISEVSHPSRLTNREIHVVDLCRRSSEFAQRHGAAQGPRAHHECCRAMRASQRNHQICGAHVLLGKGSSNETLCRNTVIFKERRHFSSNALTYQSTGSGAHYLKGRIIEAATQQEFDGGRTADVAGADSKDAKRAGYLRCRVDHVSTVRRLAAGLRNGLVR